MKLRENLCIGEITIREMHNNGGKSNEPYLHKEGGRYKDGLSMNFYRGNGRPLC